MSKASSYQHSKQQRRRSKNQVKFSSEESQVQTFDVPEDIPYEDLWFTVEEYDTIKSQTRSEARAWRKMGYSTLLKDTFEMPRHDAQNYINVFCALEGKLNLRGLERHCSRKHGEERSDCKDRARQSVFASQSRLSKEGLKPDEIADSISASYINSCREAKIFSRRMGKADELVALEKASEADQAESILVSCRSPKMQRRMSNFSCSEQSMTSFGSQRNPGVLRASRRKPPKTRCPSSPASPAEELYAAIA